ncbi:hypothetical protein [Haematomicrobium sanguinis]|uniref:hypothetical protein n=1 Tax=Haematomicrobium sanguinis TaxID=479106 RepID=UPI00047A0934|nr:hypothetical protein [Haematomicrobium sanguinis]
MSDRDVIRDAVKSVDPLVALSRAGAVPEFHADLSFLNNTPAEGTSDTEGAEEFHDRGTRLGQPDNSVTDLGALRRKRIWQGIAAVAAAAIVALAVYFGFRFLNQQPLPATPPTNTLPSGESTAATTPSSEPTANPSLAAPDAENMTPEDSLVQPAANASECDLSGVTTAFVEEKVSGANNILGANPWMGTVIGCSQEWALVYPTQAYFYAMGRPQGLNGQLLAFQKVDGAWITTPDMVMVRFNPSQAAFELGYVGYMDQEFARMGIPANLREQFVGNEQGPATFIGDGAAAGTGNYVTTPDGAFRVPIPPGWSLQQQDGAPSGAVVNAEGGTRIVLGTNAQLGGACAPDGPSGTFETLYSAPITINGAFDSPAPANARIVVRAFTDGPYRVSIGIDRLETDRDSGQSCMFYVAGTNPATGGTFIASNAFQVMSTSPDTMQLPINVFQFEDRASVEKYLRSPEFDSLLTMLTLMQVQ